MTIVIAPVELHRTVSRATCGVWWAACSFATFALAGCSAPPEVPSDSTSGARIRRILLRSDSGLEALAGWYDREFETECFPGLAADGLRRCLPGNPVSRELYFLDEACTVGALRVEEACATPAFIIAPASAGDTCAGWSEVYAVGDERAVDGPLYWRSSGECVELSPRPFDRLRRLSRVDPSRLVHVELVPGEGTGPVVLDRLRTSDGATRGFRPRDRSRDATCSAVLARPGVAVPCTPRYTASVRNGGATCDQLWAPSLAGCDGPVPPELAVAPTTDACGQNTSVALYEIGELVPVGERDAAAACSIHPLPQDVWRTRAAPDAAPWLTREWQGPGRLQIPILFDESGAPIGRADLFWLFDDVLGTTCRAVETTAGLRCVPVALGLELDYGGYADSVCTQPALRASLGCDPPPYVTIGESSSWCPDARLTGGVYRVGGPLDVTYEVVFATGDCVASSFEGAAFALEPVPLDELAPLEHIVE